MGNNFGKPFDKVMQAAILKTAIRLACEAEIGGVLIDYPGSWPEKFSYFGT
jgi:hypothetical protein